MRTRVKICGITRPQDARDAIRCGADAIGLVFYPPSPRHVTCMQAAEITRRLPPFVSVVGLFVDADRETIAEAVVAARLDLLQFHGSERAEYCAEHGRPWIKAVRMKDDMDLLQVANQYKQANALLLDAYRPGVPGGTGEVFDWARIPQEHAERIILAGGLTPENVSEAVESVRPYAVDVSSGVSPEGDKRKKDAVKMKKFIEAARRGWGQSPAPTPSVWA